MLSTYWLLFPSPRGLTHPKSSLLARSKREIERERKKKKIVENKRWSHNNGKIIPGDDLMNMTENEECAML